MSRAAALLLDEAGQAMAEYAIVTAVLVVGATVVGFHLLPNFIDALQAYLDSFYIMLNLPIP